MRWIKRDCKIAPSGIGYLPTNDFVWRGREWELKSSLGGEIKERTIIRRIKDAERRRYIENIVIWDRRGMYSMVLK